MTTTDRHHTGAAARPTTAEPQRHERRRGDPMTVPPGMQTTPEDFLGPWQPSEPSEPPPTPWERFVTALRDGDIEEAMRALAVMLRPDEPIGVVFLPDGSLEVFDANGFGGPIGPPFVPGTLLPNPD